MLYYVYAIRGRGFGRVQDWYEPLSEAEQISIDRIVLMLMEAGPALGYPYSSGIQQSKFSHMRELRILA